jgi:hypothetical protein
MVPGQYPNGLTRIDWTNPHTVGLRRAFVSSSNGYDLVSGLRATRTNYTAAPFVSGGNIAFPGAAYYMPSGTPYMAPGEGPFTVMVRALTAGPTTEPYIYGSGAYATAGMFYLRYRGNINRIEWWAKQDDGTARDHSFTTLGLDSNNCCLLVAGIDAKLGKQFGANFTGAGTYSYSANSLTGPISGAIVTLGNNLHNSDSNKALGIFFTYVWDRFVPQAEASALARDPCQFLIPA